MVVEAKGTLQRDSPLTLGTVTAPLGGRQYVQPERDWLRARRRAQNDYLSKLQASPNKRYRQAAALLEDAFEGARYDARIVNVRPDIVGARAYGGGLDRAAETVRASGAGRMDIVDIPYPNRR